jgi:hypothetical protein
LEIAHFVDLAVDGDGGFLFEVLAEAEIELVEHVECGSLTYL